MPCSSEPIFKQTLQTAQLLEKHGRAFEEQARFLEEGVLTRVQVQVIEDAAQQIRQHSQSMIALLEQARQEENDLFLPGAYIFIHQHQHQAMLAYCKIIEMLLQAAQSTLLQRVSPS